MILSYFFNLLTVWSTLPFSAEMRDSIPTFGSLRIIKVKIGDAKSDGMDGGVFDINSFGGGEFKIQICNEANECCETGYLNTRDDNWERGEVNFFVGRQIGNCENFRLLQTPMRIVLKHKGPDGGRLEYVQLSDSFGKNEHVHVCRVDKKLDNSESFSTDCRRKHDEIESGFEFRNHRCNGDERFCGLKFDDFTFPGSHNSGTGQSDRLANCFFKNHDLNVKEQLDFGIRFFDIDVTFSSSLPYCNGLETGHGMFPQLGIYQCFSQLKEMFKQIRSWMSLNPNEVIVLYFGAIENETEAYPELKSALKTVLGDELNRDFNTKGKWPNLGEAIGENRRIFVFIRSDKVDMDLDPEFVRELQVNSKHQEVDPEVRGVSVLSTFSSRKVGNVCDFVVENSHNMCSIKSDLVKVSVFGSPGKGSGLGTECAWDMARKCNRQIRNSVQTCSNLRNKNKNINFVQVDFPNYPGNGDFDLISFCQEMNLNKV